jgi:hypothetical protein
LGIGAALVLITVAWGGAWYLVWSFAQTIPWLAAWTIGGAISGFSTGAILRLAFPGTTWWQAVLVALGWVEAWAIAWLLGSNLTGFVGWAFRQEVLAGTDPSSLTFGIGRGAAWAAGGLLMARIVRREGWRDGWAAAAVVALGWAAAGGIGHALFWVLSPARFAPGVRFAISGLVEGAIGGAFALSPMTRASHAYVASRPSPVRYRSLGYSAPWLRSLWPATRRGPSLREREGGLTGSG